MKTGTSLKPLLPFKQRSVGNKEVRKDPLVVGSARGRRPSPVASRPMDPLRAHDQSHCQWRAGSHTDPGAA